MAGRGSRSRPLVVGELFFLAGEPFFLAGEPVASFLVEETMLRDPPRLSAAASAVTEDGSITADAAVRGRCCVMGKRA